MDKCKSHATRYKIHRWVIDKIDNGLIPQGDFEEYCNGTKEQDLCSCAGDRTKCDFYPHVKEKAMKEKKASINFMFTQRVFDCAMELIYHPEGLTDKQVADKLMDEIERHDKGLRENDIKTNM